MQRGGEGSIRRFTVYVVREDMQVVGVIREDVVDRRR